MDWAVDSYVNVMSYRDKASEVEAASLERLKQKESYEDLYTVGKVAFNGGDYAKADQYFERAEKLRLGVQELAIESDGRKVGPVTLSVGIALFPEHGDSGLAVLQAADAAMYRVKVTGKNGIHVAGRDEGPRPPQEEQERH